jgi:hypothetical protein
MQMSENSWEVQFMIEYYKMRHMNKSMDSCEFN